VALTNEQISAMYEAAKRVYSKEVMRARALDSLEEQYGVSQAVAASCIRNFRHMRHGERYRRTLTGATTEYLLDSIQRDFGNEGLALALASLLRHIEYLEPARGSTCVQERALHARFSTLLPDEPVIVYPDELPAGQPKFVEGSSKQVLVNQFERDARARSACIRHWGPNCYVCGFDFHKTYGDMGRGFIHVHHLTEIASIGAEYEVDPHADLRPVCPNCHAMLHMQRPAIDIDELKSMLATRRSS
jgi:5-methylcytosine-specific restriction protein A